MGYLGMFNAIVYRTRNAWFRDEHLKVLVQLRLKSLRHLVRVNEHWITTCQTVVAHRLCTLLSSERTLTGKAQRIIRVLQR